MERRRISIRGIVQGVGFRPFVYGLARDHGVRGRVLNDARGVVVDVEAEPSRLDPFVDALTSDPPPLAAIDSIEMEPLPPEGFGGFEIVASEAGAGRRALVGPDVATCEVCLREMRDPSDRRYGYPFLNCTHCGPRFTIVEDVPYDRSRTSMRRFPMCDACRDEYEDPGDRRFHAQPTACPACGPRLRWMDGGASETRSHEPLDIAVTRLLEGEVVAIKGLGGYHLACDAADEGAVGGLRVRKARDARPFALMVGDVESAARLVELDEGARRLLLERRRPIVLAPRRPEAPVAASVAPGTPTLGVMLPYTPLHALLMERVGRPLVMTSGNLSDEPMVTDDDDAIERLGDIADGFLVHDREIVSRCDDGVVRWSGRRAIPIRRARGEAPRPVRLANPVPRPILALGGHQKNAFCLARGDEAFVSHHVGDLDTLEAATSLEGTVERYERLFEIDVEAIACDMHPAYRSTRLARALADRRGLPLVEVQHHHAHVAAVAAEHGRTEPVLGIALDGTGWGPDGTVWGFEILVVDGEGFDRLGRLEPVPMPGGAAAVREPWRMAWAWLRTAFDGSFDLRLPLFDEVDETTRSVVGRMIQRDVNAPMCSSAGRLFDAVAAIAGLRTRAAYEGQPAIELEAAAGTGPADPYPIEIADAGPGGERAPAFEVRFSPAVREIARATARGASIAEVAARFHETVVAAIAIAAARARDERGLSTVALSGGTFQNARVLEGAIAALEADGFEVLVHETVPPNDGGLAYGQVAVAASRLADAESLEPRITAVAGGG